MRVKIELLNCKQLAGKMGKGPGYVTAMKSAGYVFEFGSQTTLAHALRWRRRNKGFRSTGYFNAHRKRR